MRSGRSRDSGGMAEVRSIGVVGGGQMGSGIAQLAAVHGVDVWLHDTDAEALTRATKSISTSIQRFVSKGQLSQVLYTQLALCRYVWLMRKHRKFSF